MKQQYTNKWVMPLRDYHYFLLHNMEAAGDEPNFRLLTGKCKHHIFWYDCLLWFQWSTEWLSRIIWKFQFIMVYSWRLYVGHSLWTILWILQADISKDHILVNSNTVIDRNKCGFIQQQFYNIIFSIQWWEPNAKYTHQAINST